MTSLRFRHFLLSCSDDATALRQKINGHAPSSPSASSAPPFPAPPLNHYQKLLCATASISYLAPSPPYPLLRHFSNILHCAIITKISFEFVATKFFTATNSSYHFHTTTIFPLTYHHVNVSLKLSDRQSRETNALPLYVLLHRSHIKPPVSHD